MLRGSLWPVNARLLKALTQEILRRPGCRHPRHWFVLDEFPAMEKVDCIHDLLRRGRSKGGFGAAGDAGQRGARRGVWRERADMLNQCAYKTFLRAGGPKTAEWAERFFGKVRQMEPVWSESWSRDGHSSSVQYNVIERSLFNASVFANLPFPERGGPFHAISDVPHLGCSLISRRWFDQLLAWLQPPAKIPEVIPRDKLVEQTLQPWESAEEEFHCGRRRAARSKTARPKKKPRATGLLPDPKQRKRVSRAT